MGFFCMEFVIKQVYSRAGYQREASTTLAARIEKFVSLFSPGTRQMHMNKEAGKNCWAWKNVFSNIQLFVFIEPDFRVM
jgi:hypothetical protein